MNSAFGVPGPEAPIWFDGQCQLAKSSTNLLLSRLGGKYLWVGDRAITVPAEGITFKPTGLSSSTLYYAYVRPSGVGAFSTTAYAIDPTTGLLTKSNDRFARLVGMARTDGAGAFADSATQRFVRSYFNDPGISLLNSFSTNRSTTSATYAEINSEIRNEFIIWSGETAHISLLGNVQSTTPSTTIDTSIGIDGITAEDTYSRSYTHGANVPVNCSAALFKSGLTEGYHYSTLLGLIASGTGTWAGGGTAGARTTLRGFLRR
jgi:hypothetical protein